MSTLSKSSGVAAVIFSKDRPLQLLATLDSFQINCLEAKTTPILIIYQSSSQDYEDGYRQLRVVKSKKLNLIWRREINFKASLLQGLKNIRREIDYVLLLVDDCVFVRGFSLEELSRLLWKDAQAIGVSLRLGFNTKWCYTRNQSQQMPRFRSYGGYLSYRWLGEAGDFGYPLELSSSLFRLNDVMPLLRWLPYNNPNRLEQGMAQLSRFYSNARPILYCAHQSIAFCIPVNKVQTVVNNRAGNTKSYDSDILNRRFREGKCIDVKALNCYVPYACHEELDLPLIDRAIKRVEKPRVAVLISTLVNNNADWLVEAMSSTAKGLESQDRIYLNVDGGTLSNKLKIELERVAAPIQVVFRNNMKRKGLASSLNALIEEVVKDGNYYLIARMDSDDLSSSTRFKLQREFMEKNPDIDILGGYCREVDELGHEIQIKKMPVQHSDIVKCLPRRNSLNHPTVMIKTDVFRSGLRYRTDVSLVEDYHLWISAACAGWRFANLKNIVLDFRRDRNFIKRRSGMKQACADFAVRWRAMKELQLFSMVNLIASCGVFVIRILPARLQVLAYRYRSKL